MARTKEEVKKADYVEPAAPNYRLRSGHIGSINKFETISDAEVQNANDICRYTSRRCNSYSIRNW